MAMNVKDMPEKKKGLYHLRKLYGPVLKIQK